MKEMEGHLLLDKAMNVGYKFILGLESIYESIDETEEMVFIPDPEISEEELADELIEYFLETQEYEKCANIKSVMDLKKVINKLI
tara:strand:+ start:228 stop:482 length:255 start_codon:yes stop_codon:yes gene_type:complete